MLTVIANVNNRSYDGSTALTLNGTPSVSGIAGGTYTNLFTAGSNLVATSASKSVGTHTVKFTGLTLKPVHANAGYVIRFAPRTVTISRRVLTLKASDFDPVRKTYDGTKDVASLYL